MKPITRRSLVTSAAAAPLIPPPALAQPPAKPPNIVFFLADDLGYADLSCYGRPDLSTPNVDRIAADGVRFLQGYANSAVCSATRTALITGRYQYRLRVGLEEPISGTSHVGLPPGTPPLPSLLKARGYQTTLLGKWHLGSLPDFGPLKSGYDHFFGFYGGALDYYTHTGTDHRDDRLVAGSIGRRRTATRRGGDGGGRQGTLGARPPAVPLPVPCLPTGAPIRPAPAISTRRPPADPVEVMR